MNHTAATGRQQRKTRVVRVDKTVVPEPDHFRRRVARRAARHDRVASGFDRFEPRMFDDTREATWSCSVTHQQHNCISTVTYLYRLRPRLK